MNIVTVGLDLAKSVLRVRAMDSQGQIVARKQVLSIRADEHSEPFRVLIQMLVEHLRELGSKVAELEGRIRAIHRTDAPGQLLETIPGVGPLTLLPPQAAHPLSSPVRASTQKTSCLLPRT